MTSSESLSTMKALADSSRLLIMHVLMEKPQYVEELSERLNLAASTVSFHLKKLENADLVSKVKEQYYVMYHANHDVLAMRLRDLVAVDDIEKTVQEERLQRYRQKVLQAFFQDGKLLRIPAQRKKRRIIFEEIAKRFEAGRTYPEKEVNTIIAKIYEDYCTIRRELIDENMMSRKEGNYWSLSEPSDFSQPSERQQQQRRQKEKPMDRKKALKLAYKQTPLPAGVFQIKNHTNGKILIGSGANVNGKLNRHQAELKMGVHRNKALQQDWNEYGPERFSFEVLECLDPSDDPQYDYREDLAVLEQLWLKKLQPYGEKGYNRRPK